MKERLSYSDCYEVLATYANDVLELFADGWSRFPSYPNAGRLMARLDMTIPTWEKIDMAVAETLKAVRNEIDLRA